MTDLSFEEAAQLYAKAHNIGITDARMAVADEYVTVTDDRTSEVQHAAKMDRRLPDDGLFYHPRPKIEGRPIRIDSLPSPAWMLAAGRAVREAKREGDRYRELSRETSMHLVDQ